MKTGLDPLKKCVYDSLIGESSGHAQCSNRESVFASEDSGIISHSSWWYLLSSICGAS